MGGALRRRNPRRCTVLNRPMPKIWKLVCTSGATLLALAAGAAPASARILEVGQFGPAATPSCPSPCIAISRTTGYQATVGGRKPIARARADGRIVAWTISLGTPTAEQKRYFDRGWGGRSSAGITVLNYGRRL